MTTTYYQDRSYPQGELEIANRGDFIRIEYSSDGYNVDAIYVPLEAILKVIERV